MIPVKNSCTENAIEIYWGNLAEKVCVSFSFTEKESRSFLSNKAAKLIGCLPKIAETKTPERDGCSNLAVYIMSIRETKPFYNHQECDDEDVFARLHNIMNFNGGDKSIIKKGMNLVKAWRVHLGMTQAEVAEKAAISQAALSQMEKSENKLRTATLEKLAGAIGLSVEQLRD